MGQVGFNPSRSDGPLTGGPIRVQGHKMVTKAQVIQFDRTNGVKIE